MLPHCFEAKLQKCLVVSRLKLNLHFGGNCFHKKIVNVTNNTKKNLFRLKQLYNSSAVITSVLNLLYQYIYTCRQVINIHNANKNISFISDNKTTN